MQILKSAFPDVKATCSVSLFLNAPVELEKTSHSILADNYTAGVDSPGQFTPTPSVRWVMQISSSKSCRASIYLLSQCVIILSDSSSDS